MRVYVLLLTCLFFSLLGKPQQPRMMYEDTSRRGVPFSKDPHVVNFQGRYLMYYTLPPRLDVSGSGANIGIASSKDLVNWSKVGEITPEKNAVYEKNGLCAPGALVRDGKIHLFYQTYGNGKNDAICHAVSTDGIHFDRDPSNPVFHPTGDWNCGRAIDAEVCEFNGKYFLYFATRDKDFKIQMQGVATASLNTDFNREDWTQACDKSILYPECDWEGECIEGASIVKKDNKLYLSSPKGYVPPSCTAGGKSYTEQCAATVDAKDKEEAIELWKKALKDSGTYSVSVTVLAPETMKDAAKELIQGIQSGIGTVSKVGNHDTEFSLKLETAAESEVKTKAASGDYDIVLYPLASNSASPITFLNDIDSLKITDFYKNDFEKALEEANAADSASLVSACFFCSVISSSSDFFSAGTLLASKGKTSISWVSVTEAMV